MLRADIEAGRIEPDAALPSLTRLVQETGLDVKTVRKAIVVLTAEGLAYIVPGRARSPANASWTGEALTLIAGRRERHLSSRL